MRVTVAGLSHLGCVTAAGLASAGHRVVGYDPEPSLVRQLASATLAPGEPGLAALLAAGVAAQGLSFSASAADALAGAEALWVAADTPLDDDDHADLQAVRRLVGDLVPVLPRGCLVVISSQVAVGFTRSLERSSLGRGLRLAYVPENLRLGVALECFLRPELVPVGLVRDADRAGFERLLAPLGWPLEWMSVESAELAKQALNAFLATSAAFANELARLCAGAGADAKQVERALRGDGRVGTRPYLSPGAPFSGGTLARDLRFLSELARRQGAATPLLDGVLPSNDQHLAWLHEIVLARLAGRQDPTVAILGLAYKPAAGAPLRSFSLELCRRLSRQGVALRVHDPAATGARLPAGVLSCGSVREALTGADLAVLATPWPEYLSLESAGLLEAMRRACVVDPGWFLAKALGGDPRIDYVAAGRGELGRPASPGERGLER